MHDRELRREWIHRILDHDGHGEEPGGIERWLTLTDGLGLPRDYVMSRRGALPATKFAVEAYVRFVVEQPLVVAVASSLTELFAPPIHRERISGMLENYDFIDERRHGLFQAAAGAGAARRRFRAELRQGACAHAAPNRTPASTRCVSNATCCGRSSMRCNHAYVTPGVIPPGAFRPGQSHD